MGHETGPPKALVSGELAEELMQVVAKLVRRVGRRDAIRVIGWALGALGLSGLLDADEYTRLAGQNAKVFREFGATRVIETLGDDIQHGKVTDFYRAVKAEEGETVAFSFIEWPDKAARDEAWQKIMQDQRMQHGGGLFDGKRLFWGGFEVVIDTSRSEQAGASASTPVTA